jgi:hypothetical protein
MIEALDLLNETGDRLGYPQIDTLEVGTLRPEHRKLLRLLNTVLQAIGGYHDWPMLREEGTLVLVAAVEGDADSSEFVTATQNSTTVTIDNVSMDDTYIGRAFQVDGDEYIYRIEAVPAPTQLTLNRAWVSDSITATDEKTFTIGADRYALPEDFGRAVDDWDNFFAPYTIKAVDPREFRRQRVVIDGNNLVLDDPHYFTIFGVSNSRQVVVFHPWPENARLLTYEYQRNHPKITSDQDTVYYPVTYRTALIDLLTYIARRDYEDDARIEAVLRDWLSDHSRERSNPGATASRIEMQLANEVRQSVHAAYGVPTNTDWGDYWETGAIFGL